MKLLPWLKKALNDHNMKPSMTRLGYFIAVCTLAGVAISLAASLISNPAQEATARALGEVCFYLAGLGAATVGGIAFTRKPKNDKPDEPA